VVRGAVAAFRWPGVNFSVFETACEGSLRRAQGRRHLHRHGLRFSTEWTRPFRSCRRADADRGGYWISRRAPPPGPRHAKSWCCALLFDAKEHHRRTDIGTSPAFHLAVSDCGWKRVGVAKRRNRDFVVPASAAIRLAIDAVDSENSRRSHGPCRPGLAGFALLAFRTLRTREAYGARRPSLAGFALLAFRALRTRGSYGARRPSFAGFALLAFRALRTRGSYAARRPSFAGFALLAFRAWKTGRTRLARTAGLALRACGTLRPRRTHFTLGARRPCKPLRPLRTRDALLTLTPLGPLRTFRSLAAARQHERDRQGRNDEN
jgi:hypothetical protein